MTLFSDLVNDVLLLMEGYGLDQGRAAFITGAPLTATGLSFTVDDVSNIGPGLAELGDELIFVQSVDDGTKTVTVSPDGRGYRGTLAAAHPVGTRLTSNPVVPRSLVKRKINETITGLYPTLWGVGTAEVTFDPVVAGYAVPSDLEEVLQVTFQEIGPSQSWLPVRRWSVDHNPDPTTFLTGKVLNIYDSLYSSRPVRVVYQKVPSELEYDNDDLTDTGLRATARAAVVAGAMWRLASFIDVSRLQVNTADAAAMTQGNPIGTGTQVSSYLRKQYERELQDEQQRQQLATPPILHWME